MSAELWGAGLYVIGTVILALVITLIENKRMK